MSDPDTGRSTAPLLPQHIALTPEAEAALDAYWRERQIAWAAKRQAEAEAVVARYLAADETATALCRYVPSAQ